MMMAGKLMEAARKLSRLGPYRGALICSQCGWICETQNFRFAEGPARKEGRKLAQQKFDTHVCSDFPRRAVKK